MKNNLGRGLIITLTLSILFSSYTEKYQQIFFREVKNIFFYNKWTYQKQQSDKKLYNGTYYFNPVAFTQTVRDFSENELINISGESIPKYSDLESNTKEVIQTANFLLDSIPTFILDSYKVKRLKYDFDYEFYEIKNPWYSGMAQGHAIIILLHSHLLTGKIKYLKAAEEYANLLRIDIRKGGVLRKTEKEVGFEEYAAPGIRNRILVLNGNLYAIDGLFWISRFSQDKAFEELLNESIISLEKNIQDYSAMFHSYYDLNKNYANSHYHKLHIKQLKRVIQYNRIVDFNYPLTKIKTYLKSWQRYDYFPFLGYVERLLFNRNNMIYVIFISNFLIFFLMFHLLQKKKDI